MNERHGLLRSSEERDLVVKRLLAEQKRIGALPYGMISDHARICGVHRGTLLRWMEKGTACRKPRGCYRLTEVDKTELAVAKGKVSAALRNMELYGLPMPPSESTYRRAIARELDEGTVAGITEGAAARQQKRLVLAHPPYLRQERWEADHKQANVLVIPPPPYRKPIRPWVSWLIDCGTRYLGGLAVAIPEPNRGTVLALLRIAIARTPHLGPFHGVPRKLVWDNDPTFTANACTDGASMLNAYAGPTFVYSPEQKPFIESFNKTAKEEFFITLPYYTDGPRRKDGTLYGPGSGPISLAEFVQRLLMWVDHYNFERVHGELQGRTPLRAFLDDATPLQGVDPEALRRFTLERVTRKITRQGVRIDNHFFVAPEQQAHVGRTAEIGRLPYDYEFVEIFLDDRWLCTAHNVVEISPAGVDAIKGEAKRLNAVSGELHRKRDRKLAERFGERLAPLTAEDPQPRRLRNRGSGARRGSATADPLGFGEEIGEVERS